MSTHAIWIAIAFGMTALWATMVIVNKLVLVYVNPVPLNFLVRIGTILGTLAITVPLTAFSLWSNGFGINATAAGWITLSGLATWLLAFNAYYYALRAERVAVITPIYSTDPLWTALFAWALLGAAFGVLTLGGMAVAMIGIVLISRWMDESERTVVVAGATHGDVLPAVADPPGVAAGGDTASTPASSRRAGRLQPVALATVAAMAWGLGPVFISLAANAYGKVTATMMLLSPSIGLVALGALLLLRRQPVTVRPLTAAERRRVMLLVTLAAMLESSVGVLYYLCIPAIGPVLTMLIMATTPVFTMVFGVVFLRERVSLRLAAAACVTVAGVAIAALDGLF